MRTILSTRGVAAFLVGDETKIYLFALFLISWFVEMSEGGNSGRRPQFRSRWESGVG